MKTNLILDGNNILYRTFHATNRSGDPDEVVIGMCIHSALMTMNKYYNLYSPDNVVMTFDDYSWRKEYTKDLSKCVTNKKYKGHRRQDQTPKQKRMQQMLEDHMEEFYEILRDKTSVITLKRKYLEGDDLMAAWVQMHREDNNVVVSGDQDMIQLLRYEGVTIVNPANGQERTLKDWEDDPDLFLFEKCIRGEQKTNDNIQSSYPRLRRDRLVKAYHDEYERNNVMNHTFVQLEEVDDDYEDVEYRTGDLFKENQLLMDLRKQPKNVKVLMGKTIMSAKENRGKYHHVKFLKFCTVNELQKIIERIEDYVPMLSSR